LMIVVTDAQRVTGAQRVTHAQRVTGLECRLRHSRMGVEVGPPRE